ncbi:MAG: DUF4198 domain-containing protein [Planctomycetota bacterium]
MTKVPSWCAVGSVFFGLLLVAGLAQAHDMWLIPPRAATVGSPATTVVSVGMDFPVSEHAIPLERLTLQLLRPDGRRAEVAELIDTRKDEAAKHSIVSVVPDTDGLWVLGCSTRPNQLELDAEKFNDYLLHDGLLHVYKMRFDAGELGEKGREQYSKYTKCLIPVGNAAAGSSALQPLGLRLEIVPLADPLACRAGGALAVKVLFEGAPLPKANLCWDHSGNGEDFTGQTWTDEAGVALVPVAKSGLFTLRLVHMTRPKTADYEWESFWASLTWYVPDSASGAGRRP